MSTKVRRRRRPAQHPRYFSRFLEAYLNESRAVIDALAPERWKAIEQSMLETLATPEGKLPDPKVTLTQRQLFFRQLRMDFDELHTCFETLSDFPELSRMPWPRHSSLTAGKVILFWREAHFNECYIYHLRLLAFLAHLRRAYRKDPRQGPFIAALDALSGALETDFSKLKAIRGQHVHQFRHRHIDAEVDRLALLELLARDPKPIFSVLYRGAVHTAKANNVKRFTAFVRRMRRDLDAIFRIISIHIVSNEDRLIYPSQLKN